ncbi:DUF1294 domain-containing protein [Puniceicoccaceae bacterium K14]|nr:DUF1294 domain-containing protein [Puniceicoccaceae bacterium K14]
MHPITIYILIGINCTAFLAYAWDKLLAKWKKRRISEKNLLLLTFLGGSIGALLGMMFCRHKISKTLFRISVPIALIVHAVALWKLHSYL